LIERFCSADAKAKSDAPGASPATPVSENACPLIARAKLPFIVRALKFAAIVADDTVPTCPAASVGAVDAASE
jgi:hypothetical protein